MVKKILIWVVILFSLIVLLINTGFYINCAISMEYEVIQQRDVNKINKLIEIREQELQTIMNFNKIIYVFSITVLLVSFFLLKNEKVVRTRKHN